MTDKKLLKQLPRILTDWHYTIMIRQATLNDLDALISLENEGFESDRLSRRSYRNFLTKDSALILVDEENGVIRASCVVLFRQGSLHARLYSLVVAKKYQGQGLAKALFRALEEYLIPRGYQSIFLEVRADNIHAITLYKHQQYEIFGTYDAYYADKMQAIRMRKMLRHGH